METPNMPNFCNRCGYELDQESIAKNTCSNCNAPISSMSYQENVGLQGKKISRRSRRKKSEKPTVTLKDVIKPIRDFSSSRFFTATIVGSVGLVLVSFAIVQIISAFEFSFPLYYISISGFVLFSLLILTALFLKVKSIIDPFSTFLILTSSELILISSNYYVDINEASSLNRHLLLAVAVIFTLLIVASVRFIENSRYDSIHRVLLIYFSSLIIFHVAGHEYVSKITLTMTLGFMIILLHYSIIQKPIPSVAISGLVLEFFMLIQTNLINSVVFEIISFVVIISIPLILGILELSKSSKSIGRRPSRADIAELGIPKSLFFSLLQIPQLGVAVAVILDGLSSPYSEVLIATYAIIWVIYLQFSKSVLKEEIAFFKTQSLVISFFMITSLALISINNTSIGLIPVFVAVIGLALYLIQNLTTLNQIRLQTFGVLINGFVTANLVINDLLGPYSGLTLYSITSVAYFVPIWIKEQKVNDYMVYSIWFSAGLMLSYQFIENSLKIPLGLMGLYSVLLFGIFALYVADPSTHVSDTDLFNEDFSHICFSFSFILPFSVFLTDLPDESEKFWLLISASYIFVSFLFLKHRNINPKMILMSFLLLLLPVTYSLTVFQNEVYLTLVSVFVLFMAISTFVISYSYKTNAAKELLRYLVHFFYSLAILSRFVNADVRTHFLWEIPLIHIVIASIYVIWIVYLLYEFNKTETVSWKNFIPVIIGFSANFLVLMQLLISPTLNLSFEMERLFIGLNQVFLLGCFVILFRRGGDFQESRNLYFQIQIALFVIEVLNFLILNAIEIVIYHSILLVFLLYEIRSSSFPNIRSTSILWLLLAELVIILYANYSLITLIVMLIVFQITLLMDFKPRTILDNYLEFSNSVIKTVLYDLFLMILMYVTIGLIAEFFIGYLIGYTLFLVITAIYLLNSMRVKPFTNTLILNALSLFQFYWVAKGLNLEFELQLLYVVGYILILLSFIFSDRNDLFSYRSGDAQYFFEWPSIGISTVLIVFSIQVSQLATLHVGTDNHSFYQGLGIILILIAASLLVLIQRFKWNQLFDGILISTSVLGLGFTLFGFFETAISNLLISLITLLFLITYIFGRSEEIFLVAKALFGLTLAKGLFDLILLDAFNRGISLLGVGVNGILLAIILQTKSRAPQRDIPVK